MKYPYAYYNSHMRSAYNLGGDRYRQDIDESFKVALELAQLSEDELRTLAMKEFKDQVANQIKHLFASLSAMTGRVFSH